MKKIYQKPVTESHVVELHPLMDGNSVTVNMSTDPAISNGDAEQYSRESGWDYDD